MSQPQPSRPAKLIIGFFSKEKTLIDQIIPHLISLFGDIDIISPWFAFNFTNYYAAEMGHPLYRRMLVFETLIEQERLAAIKVQTNTLEQLYVVDGKRRANLDPGYLLFERFVLATGKNYAHRISIGRGIYADLTLIFENGNYQPLPWTYPDYADKRMRTFLIQVRQQYRIDLSKTERRGKQPC